MAGARARSGNEIYIYKCAFGPQFFFFFCELNSISNAIYYLQPTYYLDAAECEFNRQQQHDNI